ncbi:hypothetical protein ACTFIY_002716 [Dictyostelium cf. discoideum]
MTYISKKQAAKKVIVREKPILVRLKLIIGAGTASMTPPLGPNLGQYGINSIEFFNDFNTETKELFETGLALRVILWINVMKAFYFELQMPKISNILKEYYKVECEAAKGGNVYIEKERLLKDCFKIAILLCTFNKAEKQWEQIEKKYLRITVLEILGTCRSCKIYNYKKQQQEIITCFQKEGPIFIGQLLALNGSDYNKLRKYAIEHNVQIIHINANQVKTIFGSVKPLEVNNTMIIVKAPTLAIFNEVLEYLHQYKEQILPLQVLVNDEGKSKANLTSLKKENVHGYYRVIREANYLEYKKLMKVQGTTKEEALKTFTKMLQITSLLQNIKLLKLLNDYNKSNNG